MVREVERGDAVPLGEEGPRDDGVRRVVEALAHREREVNKQRRPLGKCGRRAQQDGSTDTRNVESPLRLSLHARLNSRPELTSDIGYH
jgi:hypothetical protein